MRVIAGRSGAALCGLAILLIQAASAEPVGPGLGLGADRARGPGPTSACTVAAVAEPAPGGLVRLRADAPCAARTRVLVRHGELAVSYRLPASGRLDALLPAFAEAARYDLQLEDGAVASAVATVPGAETYERVVTMWTGPRPLELLARETGAGSARPVAGRRPETPGAGQKGAQGVFLMLGTAEPEARRAEVYSYPADAGGTVRLAHVARVTAATCGRRLAATVLQVGAGLPGRAVALRWQMPPCGAAPVPGETADLVLKNLVRDLKIAFR